ncbi:hypothetical protein [Neobacillus niacini]|uniref:hypothetical protein n=1 Tax=Neobacillus niacini TaxID=86668 RepID=UPI0005EE97C1|nr:hypothetical protein [Neobacillus niacini]
MAQEKLLANSRRNLSKAQRESKQMAEKAVVTNATKPKPNDNVKNRKPMLKLFNQLTKLNDHFTLADSISMNTLVFNLYLKSTNEQKLLALDVDSDECERYILRLEKFNKQINESMKQLCIPLNARLSLANDMAKVMIEEKKLEQMIETNKPQPINPLLALLLDDDDDE